MNNAVYVSLWDDGTEVTTECNFNPKTNEVSDIEIVDVQGLDILDEEYIIYNGNKITNFKIN